MTLTESAAERNIQVVLRHFALEERGDSDAVLDDMLDPPSYFIPAFGDGQMNTRDEIQGVHNMLSASFAPLKIDLQRIFATDDRVCAEVKVGGVLRQEFAGIPVTGHSIYISTAAIFEMVDGKIASETVYMDSREALRQIDAATTSLTREAEHSYS